MSKRFDKVIAQIAKEEGVTAEYVRKEMERAIEAAMGREDPSVQAQWAKVPRSGEKVTPEELITYIAGIIGNM